LDCLNIVTKMALFDSRLIQTQCSFFTIESSFERAWGFYRNPTLVYATRAKIQGI